MAAMVTGLILSDGCHHHLQVLCSRLVTLLLCELPFTKLGADFTRSGTGDSICAGACFSRRSHKPATASWDFIYVPVIQLTELFASHLRFLATDVAPGARGKEEARAASTAPGGRTVIDLHRDRCSADICSELYVYVGAAPEKHMSIYALPSISGLIIVCSVLFHTARYLCNV